MEEFQYSPIKLPLIAKKVVEIIIESYSRFKLSTVSVTLDLGLSYHQAEVRNGRIYVDEYDLVLDLDRLKESLNKLKNDSVYVYNDGTLTEVAFYSDETRKFYKLVFIDLGLPTTIEINGIHMHRVIGLDPYTDAKIKVSQLSTLVGKRVLDICTGLGYTAIWAKKLGAKEIVTIEYDKNVLNIAQLNPWSWDLSDIRILLGDAAKVITKLPDDSFDAIMHDPPRFEMAGELYSRSFYMELHRVLKPGGVLFHYTGQPGKHSNIDILKGIKRRLLEAGFYPVIWVEKALGFKAFKPRA